MKISVVLGTRPEIIKLSSVIRELQNKNIEFDVIHTNQHYSANMDSVFFQELELPQPKFNLGIMATQHGEMTGKMLIEIEAILLKNTPDWVIVQGDTNSVLAGALAAVKLGIKVAHVEAGLRSYDRSMPEEINRVLTDHISDLLFVPTETQRKNLLEEGIKDNKIKIVGNTIVDAVKQNMVLVAAHTDLDKYQFENYFLLTIHRPANVDNPESLKSLLDAIEMVAKKNKVIVRFPIHPRTKKNLEKFGITINKEIFMLMEPVGYLEMLALEKCAQIVLTDSGGIQEEACILQTPTLTLRENTERPETIEVGSNILVGTTAGRIQRGVEKMQKSSKKWKNPFGNGNSGSLIVSIINSTS